MRNRWTPTTMVLLLGRPANWPTGVLLKFRMRMMLRPTAGETKPEPSVRLRAAPPRWTVVVTVRLPNWPVPKPFRLKESVLLLVRDRALIDSLKVPRASVAPLTLRLLAAAIWLL